MSLEKQEKITAEKRERLASPFDKLCILLYIKIAMLSLVNFTWARNNLSRLINEVVEKKKTFVLIRGSTPQAVIIPYDEYQKMEEEWQKEVAELMRKGRKIFKKWLVKNKISPPKSEDELYQIVNQVAGRD